MAAEGEDAPLCGHATTLRCCPTRERNDFVGRLRSQVPGRQPRLEDLAPSPLQLVGARLGTGGDDLHQLVADEPQSGAVLGSEARGHTVEQVAVERSTALAIAV